MKNIKNALYFLLLFAALTVMCIKPETVKQGAQKGIEISLNIIVPSLFMYMFVSSLIIKRIKSVKPAVVFLISALGGYPLGAKIIEDLYKNERISRKNAEIMRRFCVNAGPGFIISTVGFGIFGNKKIGLLLLFSHIFSSFLIMIFSLKFLEKKVNYSENNKEPFSESIVKSAEETSKSILTICAFTVIFSVLCEFFKKYKMICIFFEISNALFLTDNIYLISFLLGFSGLCVWMQVFSISRHSKVNIINFALSRVVHGALSSLITYLIILIFNIKITTISNGLNIKFIRTKSGVLSAVSLVIMIVVLIVQISDKNYSGNLKKDIV